MSFPTTSAGAVISIGTTAADPLADSYLTVSHSESIPEFGRTYQVNTFKALDDRGVFKYKGSFDDGTIAVPLGWDAEDDAGQAAAEAAADVDEDYNFKVELSNAPEPETDSTPSIWYFKAKVASFTLNIGDVEALVRATMTLAVKSGSLQHIPASTPTT